MDFVNDFTRHASHNFNSPVSLTIAILSATSAVAIFLVLGHIAVVVGAQVYRRVARGEIGERILVTTPLGIYVVSLLISALLSSIGGAMGFEWVRLKTTRKGFTCSEQAMVLQTGSLATAFFVFYISCHAFNAVVLRRSISKWVVLCALIALWSVVLFLSLAGPYLVPQSRQSTFYGPAGSWCWITSPYRISQKTLLAIPMLVVSGLNLAMFVMICLCISSRSLPFSKGKAMVAVSNQHTERGRMKVMKYLVWYPIVYALFNFPLAMIAVASDITGVDAVASFAKVTFSLQGIAFALLFILTHRIICGRPWRIGVGSVTLQGSPNGSIESFEALEKSFSPPSPRQTSWKPAATEWVVPVGRNPVPLSVLYPSGGSTSVALNQMLQRLQTGHQRSDSQGTMVERPKAGDGEPVHGSVWSDKTLVDTLRSDPGSSAWTLSTPDPAGEGISKYSKPSIADASRLPQPLPPALRKGPSTLGQNPGRARKEPVRFASSDQVYNISPVDIEGPVILDDYDAVSAVMLEKPSAVATTRKPVPRVDLGDARPTTPTDFIPRPHSISSEDPHAQSGDTPRPMLVIPGRVEDDTQDALFVMETPIQLSDATLPAGRTPLAVITALKKAEAKARKGSSETPSSAESMASLDVPVQVQPYSPILESPENYDTEDAASSILLYYVAEPSPPMVAEISPLPSQVVVDVPRIEVQEQEQDQQDRVVANSNPFRVHSPGMLAPPTPSRGRSRQSPGLVPPKAGYI